MHRLVEEELRSNHTVYIHRHDDPRQPIRCFTISTTLAADGSTPKKPSRPLSTIRSPPIHTSNWP